MGMGVAVGLVMGIMDMVEGLEVSLLLFVFLYFLSLRTAIHSFTIHVKFQSAVGISLALRNT